MKLGNGSRAAGVFMLAAFMSACKIVVTPPTGGSVLTEAGSWTCDSGSSCTIDVVDLFFDETFIASASNGFAFTGWSSIERSFCGGSTQPCRLATSGFAGNEQLMAFLESDEEFFLSPTYALHDRRGFDSDWEGELLGKGASAPGGPAELDIELFADGDVKLYEERPATNTICEYSGRFNVSSAAGRNASDAVSGRFQCETTPFTLGTFHASLSAVTDHHLIVEITSTPDDGEPTVATYVLAREESDIRSNARRAASLTGVPVSRRNLRTFEALVVYSGGGACLSQNDLDSRVQLTLARSGGAFNLSMTEFGEPYCEFNGTSGQYQCVDNAERGNWKLERIAQHRSAAGTIIAGSLSRTGANCSNVAFAGHVPSGSAATATSTDNRTVQQLNGS